MSDRSPCATSILPFVWRTATGPMLRRATVTNPSCLNSDGVRIRFSNLSPFSMLNFDSPGDGT